MTDPSNSEPNDAIPQLDVACWYRRVYAQCQAKLISAADAEDAVQETFLRAMSRIGELRKPESMGSWLRGIAHNVCVDMIRKNKVRQAVGGPVIDSLAEERSLPNDTEPLLAAVSNLPETQREVVLLHYYDKMTYDQMADWLGVARSTVNERLGRARATLKKKLVEDGSLP